MSTKTAKFYAVAKATRARYGSPDPETGLRKVDTIKIAKITQSYPATLERDTVVMRLSVTIPDSAFAPLIPAAVITVPESMIDVPVIVEAIAASEDRS